MMNKKNITLPDPTFCRVWILPWGRRRRAAAARRSSSCTGGSPSKQSFESGQIQVCWPEPAIINIILIIAGLNIMDPKNR